MSPRTHFKDNKFVDLAGPYFVQEIFLENSYPQKRNGKSYKYDRRKFKFPSQLINSCPTNCRVLI